MDLSDRLRLSFDQLEILRGGVKAFENYYQLNLEFKRLREIMRTIIHKAIDEYNWLIFGINVWFLNMNVMDFSSLQKSINPHRLKPDYWKKNGENLVGPI
ncbi:hypothetical protein Glove_84g131 [Diversispora epigaea]|uniref:Uncharacterized protein n=1 Tax=Diversispora epigaea TaxID=1348612 RepID=A0A397JG57_9GLOM|nr:hypothetical protein Glove_84g131 [Diversispora epigaea]